MRAAVLHGRHDLRVEEVPVPPTGPQDVLVRVHACGICASDVHYLETVITHSLPLDSAAEAFDIVRHQKDQAIKVMVTP
jgi:threonine dehydrogenase-like Zn-dependent dehydrogenase